MLTKFWDLFLLPLTGLNNDKAQMETLRYHVNEQADLAGKQSLRYSKPGMFNTVCCCFCNVLKYFFSGLPPAQPTKDIDRDPELRYGAEPASVF